MLNNVSFILDMKIIYKTDIINILKKNNIKILKNFMNKKIAIIGAGGHGKVVGEIALLNEYK
jgi:shikimate 5-dehydrogenase